ncbi:helix-turn-helix transcriptional regulator [Gordonia sp. HY442]|uniref:helix-turn-helix domain-containing protein n=1 Tax=Gordonia zhenghanii TaxID=2911516 RepID=UPI001F43C659|nr:helix-turn-helix transcriptional regulator [Gordonia zhenghanii]MCF8607262.1 helix-turn-helix transcriptional regulator [Gordonia zhenghanii]
MTVVDIRPMAASIDASLTAVGVPATKAPLGAPAYFAVADNSTVRPALSRREVEVLLAWLVSDSKEEAAARLFISSSTVSTHISRIRAKYGVIGRPAPTKAHLLARALQDGFTTLDVW